MVLRCFGLQTGIDFAHFWSGIGYGFLRKLRECMNVFIVSVPNELEKNLKWILQNFFGGISI